MFLLPLAPEALIGATTLAAALCRVVAQVGLIYGPRVLALADALFCEGAGGAAMGAQDARIAPQVIDRLVREFSDLPNARRIVVLTQQALERALTGPNRLYGKEVEAVLDYCEKGLFDYEKIGNGMHEAARRPICWVAEKDAGKTPGLKIKPTTGGTQVPTNRHAQMIFFQMQRRARRGAQGPFLGL